MPGISFQKEASNEPYREPKEESSASCSERDLFVWQGSGSPLLHGTLSSCSPQRATPCPWTKVLPPPPPSHPDANQTRNGHITFQETRCSKKSFCFLHRRHHHPFPAPQDNSSQINISVSLRAQAIKHIRARSEGTRMEPFLDEAAAIKLHTSSRKAGSSSQFTEECASSETPESSSAGIKSIKY